MSQVQTKPSENSHQYIYKCECGKKYKLSEKHLDQQVKCKDCNRIQRITPSCVTLKAAIPESIRKRLGDSSAARIQKRIEKITAPETPRLPCPCCGKKTFLQDLNGWSPLAARECEACSARVLPALQPIIVSAFITIGPAIGIALLGLIVAFLSGEMQHMTGFGKMLSTVTLCAATMSVLPMIRHGKNHLIKHASLVEKTSPIMFVRHTLFHTFWTVPLALVVLFLLNRL